MKQKRSKKNIYMIIIFGLIFMTAGCKWLRWMEIKSQIKNFNKYYVIERNKNGIDFFKFKEPVLYSKDIKMLTGKEPTKKEKKGEIVSEIFICKRTGKFRRKDGSNDLVITVKYNKNKKVAFLYPPIQLSKILSKRLYKKSGEALFGGDLSWTKMKLNGVLKIPEIMLNDIPDKKSVLSVHGLPDLEKNKRTLEYTYIIDTVTKPSKKIRLDVTLRYIFDDENLVTNINLDFASIKLLFEFKK